LDARGFADTRDSLRWLAIRETNEYRSTGYYRDDLEAMFPSPDLGMMKRRDAIRLNVAADGRSYWAWAKTDSDFCFGIAAAEGEPTNSYYADVGPPHPPSVDDKWMAEVGKLPPDWSDD
jgi:hypothetical protein